MTVTEYLKLDVKDIRELLCVCLNVSSSWLYTHNEYTLTPEEELKLKSFITKQNKGIPLAYITGKKGFYHLELQVNEHTLIPRPETEQIIDIVSSLALSNAHIIDLGTGSGAIAITLKSLYPTYSVSACDISINTINVAKTNADLYNTDINFFYSDWFSNVSEKYDIIISNPPYINPHSEYLKALVHEPYMALVSEEQGLKDIKNIILQAPKYLKPEGYLLLEHGYNQRESVISLLCEFKKIEVFNDLNGHPRNILAQL